MRFVVSQPVLPLGAYNPPNVALSGRMRATRAPGPLEREVRRLTSTRLLDDFIRATQYRRWDRQPKCFRRLEIDDEFESRGLFHRKVARPGTFEELVDVARSVSALVKDARTEAHKSARLCKLAELGRHWHHV